LSQFSATLTFIIESITLAHTSANLRPLENTEPFRTNGFK